MDSQHMSSMEKVAAEGNPKDTGSRWWPEGTLTTQFHRNCAFAVRCLGPHAGYSLPKLSSAQSDV